MQKNGSAAESWNILSSATCVCVVFFCPPRWAGSNAWQKENRTKREEQKIRRKRKTFTYKLGIRNYFISCLCLTAALLLWSWRKFTDDARGTTRKKGKAGRGHCRCIECELADDKNSQAAWSSVAQIFRIHVLWILLWLLRLSLDLLLLLYGNVTRGHGHHGRVCVVRLFFLLNAIFHFAWLNYGARIFVWDLSVSPLIFIHLTSQDYGQYPTGSGWHYCYQARSTRTRVQVRWLAAAVPKYVLVTLLCILADLGNSACIGFTVCLIIACGCSTKAFLSFHPSWQL